jgi:hypothetical protein
VCVCVCVCVYACVKCSKLSCVTQGGNHGAGIAIKAFGVPIKFDCQMIRGIAKHEGVLVRIEKRLDTVMFC